MLYYPNGFPQSLPQVKPALEARFYYHGAGENAPVIMPDGKQLTMHMHPDALIPMLERNSPKVQPEYGWPIDDTAYAVLILPYPNDMLSNLG